MNMVLRSASLLLVIGLVGGADHTVGDHYTDLGHGLCRGPGGVNDKPNNMQAVEQTQAACEAACDSRREFDGFVDAKCVGYAYNPDANSGECILYGPKLDGKCSYWTASNEDDCIALGTCNLPNTASSEKECGFCQGKTTAKEEASCTTIGGTWNKNVWTKTGATWADADTPFTGESFPSTLIAGTTNEVDSKYNCYDIDTIDHLARCIGYAVDSSKNCTEAFTTVDVADRIEANCYKGCYFSPAPKGPKNPLVPHVGDIMLPGWSAAMSGECRGGVDFTDKVNGKYSNTAGANGKLTQTECADECIAEENCVGYAHSISWCIVYGRNLHVIADSNSPWVSDNHESTEISGTKVNKAYICVTDPPRTDPPRTDPPRATKSSTLPVFVVETSEMITTFLAVTVLSFMI